MGPRFEWRPRSQAAGRKCLLTLSTHWVVMCRFSINAAESSATESSAISDASFFMISSS